MTQTPHAEIVAALGYAVAGVSQLGEVLSNIENQADMTGVSLGSLTLVRETITLLIEQLHSLRQPLLQQAIKESSQ